MSMPYNTRWRANKRRLAALDRLEDNLEVPVDTTNVDDEITTERRQRIANEISALKQRITF